MRRSDNRGRQACRLSAYHMAKHEAAVTRARLMHEMVAAGIALDEIGRRFNTTAHAAKQAMKRHPKGT